MLIAADRLVNALLDPVDSVGEKSESAGRVILAGGMNQPDVALGDKLV